ncbi:M56 family metallopeptidase [Acetobacterium woodii]|uniref:Peptidase M56 n=1 Tax=Acetobacterium woodii (strain ATCC 29683 / DSM 1030 / JCM 2381 / KCTC 1655 / WB1) TaxID=931626 RepID=H6LFT9_ACEWD|nr:peptidase M56 [Acetobacterium woodii]AFA48227.1 peptidase M56 [Acetobacterium woodii DSM 1030]
MLEKIFIEILNLSYIGSIVILAVLLARLLLKKVPKRYTYLLWSVVLLRLVILFSFNSVLSLLPINPKPIPANFSSTTTPQIVTGVAAVDIPLNNALPTPDVIADVNFLQTLIFIGFFLWLIGMSALLIYGIISYFRLKYHLKGITLEKDNLFISHQIVTPFVLGLIKPKIYLPINLDATEKKYILLHEQTHIRRFDHVTRFASYLVLCIHWFNPLVWVSFYLSGKDMEMACDEAVINQLGYEIKKDYSQSLLNLATSKQNLRMSPLAFSEGDTKERIRNILNFKKPKFYVIAAAVIILAVLMVGLITNPLDHRVWLTENEIIKTFAAHDLSMTKDTSKKPSDYAINSIEPGIFKLKKYDGTLYIYIFDTLDERQNGSNHWEFDESSRVKFTGSITTYNSKNASIFLEAPFGNGAILDSNVFIKFVKLESLISDTVFMYLNDGKTIVYHGESEHWRGTYTLKYYNNPIEDNNGTLHMDNYGWTSFQSAYLGDDPENVKNISYKYDRAGSGGEGTGAIINDKGIVNLGGSGGNGAISNPPHDVTLTMMWNGQEESFVLQP